MGAKRAAARRVTVFSPEAGGFWVGDVLTGVDEVCAQKSAQLIVVQTAVGWQASMVDHAPIGDYFRIGRDQRLGMIVITATAHPDELAILSQIEEPMVAIAGPPPHPGGASMVIDNAGGAVEAVRHLVAHGHRRIGFVGAFLQHDIMERYRGYLSALEEAGIDPDPALVYGVQNDLSPGGREAAASIIEAGIPLSAVFASSDTHALDLIAAFAEAGVRVPDDVAIIGFDDSEIAQTAVPALTSVRQLPRVLGSAAAATLFDLVKGVPGSDGTHVLPTALIPRHSCGCFETQQEFLGASHDWNAPDWQARLREVLERALAAPPELTSGDGSSETWPGVEFVIRAFDSAVRGMPVSNVAELDEAWRSASHRTRNAETLLGLVDLLEFVGLCRQSSGDDDPETIRPRLRGFLAQARLQILRYSAIADPLRHPQAPRIVRDLARSFLNPGLRGETYLDWLRHVDATHGCLALWEPGEHGRMLRISAWYGEAAAGARAGALIAPEDFPPADWLGEEAAGGQPSTVTVVPILTPSRDWGILAAILPTKHRYYDGFWALQYGTSLVALALERDAES
ncbi:MAG TPA: substrate-binding domain-containing protein [Candidatus Limnocylindrales bacterium]